MAVRVPDIRGLHSGRPRPAPVHASPGPLPRRRWRRASARSPHRTQEPSYMMIFVGFFSCGYQLAFITAHFPALITEMSAPIDPTGWCGDLGIETTAALGGLAISVIGAANIVGTLLAGWAGKRFGKSGSSRNLRRSLRGGGMVHPNAHHREHRHDVLRRDGLPLAGHRPPHQRLGRHIYGIRYMATLYGMCSSPTSWKLRRGLPGRGPLRRLRELHHSLVGGHRGRVFSSLIHLPVKEESRLDNSTGSRPAPL